MDTEALGAFLQRHGMDSGRIDLTRCTGEFLRAMRDGLAGRPSSLLMIPTYLTGGTPLPFAPKEPLKNFRVLGLTFKDADDNGQVYFDEKEIWRAAELSSAKPLLVRLTFIGSIPNYGISFEDAAGKIRKFTISESGMDGSLVLAPFK